MRERLALEPGSGQIEHQRRVFGDLQRSWLAKRKTHEVAGRVKDLPRKSAYKWLRATEHVLQMYGHSGWRSFVPLPVELAGKWPYISVALDQGSDGVSAMNYLLHAVRINGDLIPDPSHQFQRDLQNSWSSMGWSTWLRLLVVPLNLMHGPWDGGARYHEYMEAGQDLADALERGENPFLEVYRTELQQELGLGRGPLDHGSGSELVSRLVDRIKSQRRGNKVAMCRFGALVDALEGLVQNWTVYLLQTLHVLEDSKFNLMDMQSAAAKRRKEDRPSTERTSTGEDARRLRDHCSSNVALTLALLSDWQGRSRALVIHIFSQPFRIWYGRQSVKLRSLSAARQWFQDQAVGEMIQPVIDTLSLLRSANSLEECGIAHEIVGVAPGLEHEAVMNERSLAQTMGEYCLELVHQRLCRLMWFAQGHLASLAKLASNIPAKRQKAAEKMRERTYAWRAASERSAWWRALASRSD
eukprot:2258104-Amphidinium_carterae.1